MCGIAGFLGVAESEDARRAMLAAMCDTIVYRGPDDRGTYIDTDVALGMQRLSVIDIAGGHQPMASEDGAVQIVFNGEIFNYRDIRRKLELERGARFRTVSDTETILRQYVAHGLDGFHELNGMFAVAIWDRRERALHLVRDRLGVKPLYYYWDGQIFAFGSEIKAILALAGTRRDIEPGAIWDYLTFRYVPGPGTMWKNIFKLPAGHRLVIKPGMEPCIERWWDIPPPNARAREQAELVKEFGDLFTDAVERRMIADVPVGIMLSGGLDSSAVAAVAVRSHGHNLKTFSVSFCDSPETDERVHARRVADHLGTDHAEVEIGERQFLDFLPHFVHLTDEPLADLASVPLYYVSELARRSVTVALSGEGADEILAGYDFDRWLMRREEMFPAPTAGPLQRLYERLGLATRGMAGGDVRHDAVPGHMTNYLSSREKGDLLSRPIEARDSLDVLRAHLQRGGCRPALDQMLYLYCQDWLVEDLLMKADRMSMGHSLELRTPFLDYRLVEWAARAPAAAKVGRGPQGDLETKHVLRRFAASLLPAEIIERPKQGFPVPVYGWLSGPLAGWARECLLSPSSALSAWCHRAALEDAVRAGTAVDADGPSRHRLWNLIILEQWLRVWTSA